jgi:hypothetical protein
VIYPQGKSSDILLRYLDPAEVVVIDPWSTKLNIPALVLTLLRGGRKRIDYLQATIALIKPKFVITTTDNDMLFYRLKESLPNSITIAMQNGLQETIHQSRMADSLMKYRDALIYAPTTSLLSVQKLPRSTSSTLTPRFSLAEASEIIRSYQIRELLHPLNRLFTFPNCQARRHCQTM